MIELDEERQEIVSSRGHLLIMGGPGSGKTTIALFKAKNECKNLKPYQKILFLSFARSTVLRVLTQCKDILAGNDIKQIEVSTYHAFAWDILKTNSSLISTHSLSLLPPHEEASIFSGMSGEILRTATNQEFKDTGRLCFDLFAHKLYELFSQSQAIRRMTSDVFPIVILDEFQDTNMDEWNMVSVLGENSTLIVLADPEQRIYDFRGASPARISELISKFSPQVFDFGKANNRSKGTDIVDYGNDLLTGVNRGKKYNDVKIYTYEQGYNKDDKHLSLKHIVLKYIRKLSSDNTEWSMAILTPSNSLMIDVSDFLYNKQCPYVDEEFPSIEHNVLIDTTGPTIAAILITYLLESGSQKKCTTRSIIEYVIKYISGHKGGQITQTDQNLCSALGKYINGGKVRGKNREALINMCDMISSSSNSTTFSGDIIADWKSMRELLNKNDIPQLSTLYNDALHIRLLRKGSLLFSSLSTLWRNNLNYSGAIMAVQSALTQEHFSLDNQHMNGLNVMTIHKSKGKEFDVVIIYEGIYNGRIVSLPDKLDQARLNLRVAVTRAKKRTIILTPNKNICELL